MIFNMVGGGGGGGSKATIIVKIETGSTVKLYSDSSYETYLKTAQEKTAGTYWFTNLNTGTFYIKATKGVEVATTQIVVSELTVYIVQMSYDVRPVFTYTGNYEIVDDMDNDISSEANWSEDWKIRFLTSGTLTFSDLKGANNGIDIFVVGGGGGTQTNGRALGGGGGYTNATYAQNISVNTSYSIAVGDGGVGASNGGISQFYLTADSQNPFVYANGGAYGKGGGGAWGNAGNGGSGGGDYGGEDGAAGTRLNDGAGGTGQGSTTREFGGYTNTLASSVSGGNSIVLATEPTAVEKHFLQAGNIITIETGSTRTGKTDVYQITYFSEVTKTLTVDTTISTVTATAGDTIRFGNLYAGGGNQKDVSAFNFTGACPNGNVGQNANANTGGGGSGHFNSGTTNGGSGIVIIRNARS